MWGWLRQVISKRRTKKTATCESGGFLFSLQAQNAQCKSCRRREGLWVREAFVWICPVVAPTGGAGCSSPEKAGFVFVNTR